MSKLVKEEWCTIILVGDMDISPIVVFLQQIEELKLKKERVREKKMSRFEGDMPFNVKSKGKDRLELYQDIPAKILTSPLSFIKIRVVGLHFQRLFSPSVRGVIMVTV